MLSRTILFCLSILLCYSTFGQNRIHVDTDNAVMQPDGSNWPNAYFDLQDALSNASAGDTILVAEGNYYPHVTDRGVSFFLKDSVVILGGFDPFSGITELEDRDWVTYETILDGDIGILGDSTDNAYHVVQGTFSLTSSTILDGFTIQNGLANGIGSDEDGAGIYISGGSPVIRNCKIQNNTAVDVGGGLLLTGLALIEDCEVSNNVSRLGGGVYGGSYNGRMENSKISRNHAISGGGMRLSSSSAILIDLIITQNEAEEASGIYSNNSSFTLEQSRIINNVSNQSESALWARFSSDLKIKNSIVARNEGGGINVASDSKVGIINCHVVSNIGFGILNFNSLSSACYVQNSIVANNSVNGNEIGAQLGFLTIDVLHSLIHPDDPNYMNDLGGNINADPRFENLIDFQLSVCSPAREAGLDSLNTCTEDYNGNMRIVNGVIDMGAYEFQLTGTSSDICITRIHVDNSATGANDGSSWADAFTDLQEALIFGKNGDTLLIAKGTYRPAQNDRDSSFVIKNGMQLYGGFEPLMGVTELEDRDWNTYRSILSGDIGIKNDSLDNSFHVVEISEDSDSTTLLDGLVIRDGLANGSTSSSDDAGGISAKGAAIIKNCRIIWNQALQEAGGILIDDNVQIYDCIISNNAAALGAGITTRSGWNGSIVRTSIKGNVSSSNAALRLYRSEGLLEDLDISNNHCTGVRVYGGNYQFLNSNISGNSGAGAGGIFMTDSATVEINNCHFSHNKSEFYGGGINITGCEVVLYNSTIAFNGSVSLGGGIKNGGNLTTINSIIYGNTQGNSSTMIESQYANLAPGIHNIEHSLLQNSGGSKAGVLFQGGIDLGNNIDLNPRFVDSTDLKVLSCSPAIDAGLEIVQLLDVDLAGLDRIMGSTVDMGAYEYTPIPILDATCNSSPFRIYVDQDAVGYNEGRTWQDAFVDLQDALECVNDGDTILVAEGTYTPSVSNREISFNIDKNITLLGGFDPSSGATDLASRDWNTHSTVLSGDLSPTTDTAGNSVQIVRISNSASIDGFSIEGAVPVPGTSKLSAGMFVSSNPTLRNLKVRDNYGPGIWFKDSNGQLIDSEIKSNITNSGPGGGLYIRNSNVDITGCTIGFNESSDQGGGICIRDGSLTMERTIVFQNKAQSAGAIYCTGADLSINSSFIWENEAEETGGILVSGSDFDLSNSIVSYNDATVSGAGAINGYFLSTIDIVNSNIYKNVGMETGGIGVSSINAYVTNSILYGNSIDNQDTSNQSQTFMAGPIDEIYFQNSIVANSGGSSNWDSDSGTNLGSNLDGNPSFKDTIVHTLLDGSIAINAGINDSISELWDISGAPRVTDTIVDIGANEFYDGFYWTGAGDGEDWHDPDNWSELRIPEFGDDVLLYTYDDVHIYKGMDAYVQGLVLGPFAQLELENNQAGSSRGRLEIKNCKPVGIENHGKIKNQGTIFVHDASEMPAGIENYGIMINQEYGKIKLQDLIAPALICNGDFLNKGEIIIDGAFAQGILVDSMGFLENRDSILIYSLLLGSVEGMTVKGEFLNSGSTTVSLEFAELPTFQILDNGKVTNSGILNLLPASEQPFEINGELIILGVLDVGF